MPQIRMSGISGCCVASYFYDLGSAHSKPKAKNIEEFADGLISLGYNQTNLAMTNAGQSDERKYLEELGFKEVFEHRGVKTHMISGTALEKSLAPFKASFKARKEEEARLKKEAELAIFKKTFVKYAKSFADVDGKKRKLTESEMHDMNRNIPAPFSFQDIIKEVFGIKEGANLYSRGWHTNRELAHVVNILLEGKK